MVITFLQIRLSLKQEINNANRHLIENTERIPEMKIVPISAQIRDNIEELLVELKNLAK